MNGIKLARGVDGLSVYTVTFAFDGPNVLLLRKDTPHWQKGLLNGIGGKMEAGECIGEATVREFREETQLWTCQIQPEIYTSLCWLEYLTHERPIVYFSAFKLDGRDMREAVKNTMATPEPCCIINTDKPWLYHPPTMPNLPFLVEMAKCLVLCTPEERKLRQPIIPNPQDYADMLEYLKP